MTDSKIDLIQFVEKSDEIYANEADWMTSLREELASVFEPAWMRGAINYNGNIECASKIRRAIIVGSGSYPVEVIPVLHRLSELGARAMVTCLLDPEDQTAEMGSLFPAFQLLKVRSSTGSSLESG
ncbi:MAG: hypothetical protein MK135_13705 [Polyangiaceae bacterium]|nr:hypothetical protein [Polyangiaceae bacterium]